jgi:hypothetical protein
MGWGLDPWCHSFYIIKIVQTNHILSSFQNKCYVWHKPHYEIKVTFGHKPHYEIKITFGEISLKLRQMNWNVARNNVNVVVDELPSQITIYTCLTTDI